MKESNGDASAELATEQMNERHALQVEMGLLPAHSPTMPTDLAFQAKRYTVRMASAEAHANVTQLMKHVEQVEAGLIPEDSPPLFTVPQPLDAKGLPWWFGPDFRSDQSAREMGGDQSLTPSGQRVELALNYFDHDKSPLVTREAIESCFSHGVSQFRMPAPIPSPKRVWSEPQMERIRRGHQADEMEDKWHAFMEGDQLFILRSWTGILAYEVKFVQVPKGWVIGEAIMESDLDVMIRDSDALESLHLECLIVAKIMNKLDEKMERRLDRQEAREAKEPKLVLTTAEKPKIPIEKPGYSVKHGKLADQHPLQREAYDKAFAVGFQAALDAIVLKGMTEQDIYFSAQQHEEKALAAVAIESSRQAGLAKGAKMAAYKYHQEAHGLSGSKAPSGAAWTPITGHSDAGLSKALNGLSKDDWVEIKELAWHMIPDAPDGQVALFQPDKDPAQALSDLVQFWYDHNLVIDFNWMKWGRFGKGSKFSPEKAVKALPRASAEDALRLMTALIRTERFSDGVWDHALASGLFAAALDRLLRWRDPTEVPLA